eukprot:gnl/Hemi2/10986_TR3769_c0_g1_i1.p2 gnl/Hemi2/10986_TR3769_c0_g1~~gnl/Hemi2/10986_TR3769_c0_g1_i1.p2  ORF type:complete len:191 (-),score=73.98 gnl/Hemi2/10986_TR3769_c0_g1_i1:92-622(-)
MFSDAPPAPLSSSSSSTSTAEKGKDTIYGLIQQFGQFYDNGKEIAEQISGLLKQGANPNEVLVLPQEWRLDGKLVLGSTAIHHAAFTRSAPIVQALLEGGADASILANGFSPALCCELSHNKNMPSNPVQDLLKAAGHGLTAAEHSYLYVERPIMNVGGAVTGAVGKLFNALGFST